MSTVHGEINVSLSGGILRVEAVGPWNMEFFLLMHKRLLSFLPQIQDIRYGVLLIPIGETLPVPEAVDFHIRFLKYVRTSGVAVLLSETSVAGATRAICHQVYSASNIEHEFFMEEKEASAWLMNQINQAEKE